MEKKVFDSRTDLQKLIYRISSVKEITEIQIKEFIHIFNKYGAVVLESKFLDNPRNNLIEISKYFGNVVSHDRADEDGVTTIANLEGFEGYLGASNVDHPPHTGGIYSENPPVVILLQCIKQSVIGGETVLISSKKIYNHLLEIDPYIVERLKEPGVITVKRNDEKSSRPILDMKFLGNGRRMFSFRCDDVVMLEVNPAEMILPVAAIKRFIDDQKNQIRFKLKENQMLIADNSSVMHARTAFPSKEHRCLFRITTDGQSAYKKFSLNIGF